MLHSSLGLSGKQVKTLFRDCTAADSTSLELQTPWSQGLRTNLFPQKNFDVYIKNMVLYIPGEIKGQNTNYLKRLVHVDRQYTVSGLEQTWFHTGVIKVLGTWYSIKKALSSSIFCVIQIERVWIQSISYTKLIIDCKKTKSSGGSAPFLLAPRFIGYRGFLVIQL